MGRWDKSNNLEYKGANFGRRDLIEVMSYENAYCILEYAKDKYDNKKVKNTMGVISSLTPFFVYVHEVLNDKSFGEISEKDAEQFIYYACSNGWKSAGTLTRKVSNFYNFLIYINKATENSFQKLNDLYKKENKKFFFLNKEQIDKMETFSSEYLKLYFYFSLSTGATLEQIRNLKWSDIELTKRIIIIDEKILFFNENVLKLLTQEKNRRIEHKLNDCGYVFRSHVETNYDKDTPICKTTISNWCTQIGEYIGVPNLKHHNIRHTTIQRLLSASGSVGMTSMVMNYPYLSTKARYFINDNVNNGLLQEYKDICEI